MGGGQEFSQFHGSAHHLTDPLRHQILERRFFMGGNMRMIKSNRMLALILLAALATSCNKFGGGGGDAKSKGGRVQIHLPDGWNEAELPGAIGKIQAKSDHDKNAYVSVVSESKEDLHHTSIQDYAQSILKIEANKG